MPFRDPEEQRRYHQVYQSHRAKTHTSVKLTMENQTYEAFVDYADLQQQSIARTILELATQKRDNTPSLHPDTRNKLDEIIRLLRASGNNINQIAHACNIRVVMDENLPTPSEGTQYLKNIHEGMVQMEIMIERKLS